MSTAATRAYLGKILKEYSKTTLHSRSAAQSRAVHTLTQDVNQIKTAISRAAQLYNIPSKITEAFAKELEGNLSSLMGRGNLTFNDILKARARSGIQGTVTTTAGGSRTTYFLKSGKTTTDDFGNVVDIPYVDENGNKIELHKVLQVGHNESIATIQAKAQLNKLIRYKSRNKSLTDADRKLLDAFINIFDHSTNLLQRVDDLTVLDDILGPGVSKQNRSITAQVLKEWKKGGAPIEIHLTASPKASMQKKETPTGVSFEVAFDNGIKGNISAGIKSGILKGAGLLLSGSQRDELANISRMLYGETDWVDLKGSASPKELIISKVTEPITGKKAPKISSKKTTHTIKGTTVRNKVPAIPRLKLKQPEPRLRNLKGQFTSLFKLENILRALLNEAVADNMRRPHLQFQTGRFAESVELVRLQQTRQDEITAFLTYMKYPYQTFEPGFKQGHKGYDPRLLLDKSVREVLTPLVKAQIRTQFI